MKPKNTFLNCPDDSHVPAGLITAAGKSNSGKLSKGEDHRYELKILEVYFQPYPGRGRGILDSAS